MAAFSIKCPECVATLKSSKPVPAGKSITCPKCDVIFKAPAAEAPVAEFEVIEDEFDQVEIVDELTAAKEAKAGTAVKRRRPKQQFKKKSNPWPIILAVVGGLIGVCALGVGGYFAYKFVTTTRTGEPIAYIPENAPMIIGVDLAQLMSDSKIGPMIDGALKSIPPLSKYLADTNTDVRSSLDKLVFGMGFGPGGVPGSTNVAISSKTPFDKEKLAAAMGATAATVGGRNGYQIQGNPLQKVFLLVPTPNLAAMVIGNQNTVDDAARSAGRAYPSTALAELVNKASTNHIWAVFDLASPLIREQVINSTPPGPERDMMQSVTSMAVWAKINGPDLEITQIMTTPNAESAKSVSEQLKKSMASQKSNLTYQAMLLAMGARGADKDTKETAKVDVDGPRVVYTASVKMSNIYTMVDQMSKLPSMLPGLMGPSDPRGGRPGGRGGPGR